MPKDPANRAGPSGHHRKQDMIDGAAYRVEARQEMDRGQVGVARLVTRKDHVGNHVRGRSVAEFVLDARQTPYTIRLDVPVTSDDGPGFRPTALMEKVSTQTSR